MKVSIELIGRTFYICLRNGKKVEKVLLRFSGYENFRLALSEATRLSKNFGLDLIHIIDGKQCEHVQRRD